jgi:hypothetical protein
MKKNYFLAIAVAALMLAATVAQAADVSFSGQIRPRFISQGDNTDTTNQDNQFDTRIRLNAKANVNANTEVFVQMQSIATWGNAASNNDSAQANDDNASLGIHQGYVTLKNFMGQAVNAKVGRQEVVLDGHRLFGHTGWTTGAQTNHAIRLDHSAGNHTVNYVYIAAIEAGAIDTNTAANSDLHVFRAATQGILGGSLQGYFVIADDDSAAATFDDNNQWYTIGARQSGKLAGLDYRVEFYHQFGDGAVTATAANFSNAYDGVNGSTAVNSSDIDRNAQMFGVRLGKTFKNSKLSPTITLWYDSLSGTDDEDASSSDMGTFNTLQDTGHKFYGFMDQFLNATGAASGYYGLQDIAVKTKFKVSDVNTLKIDFHHFETQTDLEGADSDTLRTNSADFGSVSTGTMNGDLGQELDIVWVHKYDSNTKIVGGYGHYFSTTAFSQLNGGGGTAGSNSNSDQDWAFLMIDTKF